MVAENFDYIIVGGGSAGCVLANRLSARSANRVLLLEAGRDTPPGQEPEDILSTFPHSFFNPAYSWPGVQVYWKTAENSPPLGIRIGRVMGGSSAIMGMVALRGMPNDYDEWAELGAAGWDWQAVLPFFKKLETDTDFADDPHGKDGPVPIRRIRPRDVPPMGQALADYARNRQIAVVDDLNGDFREGFGLLPFSKFPDKRASAAICYLTPGVRTRPNLTILPEATVDTLSIEGGDGRSRVTGVTATVGGQQKRFSAREVIVSAGALQSPVLLMWAGIGPADILGRLGIPVVADRPGVGANLHAHPSQAFAFQLSRRARRATSSVTSLVALFRYSSGLAGCPPSDMYVPYVGSTGWHALGSRISSLTPTIAKPHSRGRVALVPGAAGPERLIEFDCNSDERDRLRHREGLRRVAGMLLAPELRPLWHAAVPIVGNMRARQFNTVSTVNALKARAVAALMDLVPATGRPIMATLGMPGIDVFRIAADDEALDAFVNASINVAAHYVGTCRMGSAGDPEAVVDPAGRVYGVDGLRVVDASVMPWVTRGNTNILTLMIAEKMAAGISAGPK